jgi:hypothetical protein
MSKTDHLAKAKEYLAKGEDYYRKAAEEIVAAQKDDPTLSNGAIGARLGKSDEWVRRRSALRKHEPRGGVRVPPRGRGDDRRGASSRSRADPRRGEGLMAKHPATTALDAAIAWLKSQKVRLCGLSRPVPAGHRPHLRDAWLSAAGELGGRMKTTLPVTPSQSYEGEATFLLNELTRMTDRAWSDGAFKWREEAYEIPSLKTAARIQAMTADLRDEIRRAVE